MANKKLNKPLFQTLNAGSTQTEGKKQEGLKAVDVTGDNPFDHFPEEDSLKPAPNPSPAQPSKIVISIPPKKPKNHKDISDKANKFLDSMGLLDEEDVNGEYETPESLSDEKDLEENDEVVIGFDNTKTYESPKPQPEIAEPPYIEDIVDIPYDIPKEKTIYFKIVLDRTLSMGKIYRQVYQKLEKLIYNLDKKVSRLQKSGQVGLLWGLTLITEGEPETVYFDGKLFTPSAENIKNALQRIVFQGGSDDGYEEINSAVKRAIQDMSDESSGEGNRGLLLLTDSISCEEDAKPNFTYGAEYTGLRFAQCFVYDCYQYMPKFQMENGAGQADVAGIQNLEVRDIEEYLKDDDTMVIDLLREILERTSTNVQL